MAVIDTSMDLPMSCTKCPYADIMDEFAHSWCNKLKNRYFITTDYTDKRLDECPLKEVPSGKWIRQMKSEIADSLEFWDYSPNNNPLARDMLETINTYCAKMVEPQESEDKEQKDGNEL